MYIYIYIYIYKICVTYPIALHLKDIT